MAMMTADAKLEDTGAWFRNFLQPSKAKVNDAVFTVLQHFRDIA